MKSQVLHTVWCNIFAVAAGEIWSWSLLRVKRQTLLPPLMFAHKSNLRSFVPSVKVMPWLVLLELTAHIVCFDDAQMGIHTIPRRELIKALREAGGGPLGAFNENFMAFTREGTRRFIRATFHSEKLRTPLNPLADELEFGARYSRTDEQGTSRLTNSPEKPQNEKLKTLLNSPTNKLVASLDAGVRATREHARYPRTKERGTRKLAHTLCKDRNNEKSRKPMIRLTGPLRDEINTSLELPAREHARYPRTTRQATCDTHVNGLRKLCAACPATTDLGPGRIPRYINEVLCEAGIQTTGHMCGGSKGLCGTTSVSQTFLRVTAKPTTTSLKLGGMFLESYSRTIRVACQCHLFAKLWRHFRCWTAQCCKEKSCANVY